MGFIKSIAILIHLNIQLINKDDRSVAVPLIPLFKSLYVNFSRAL